MTAIESMHSLLNLKCVGIFDIFIIKRNQAINTRTVYFEKGI